MTRKIKNTIRKEILIAKSRDLLDVIMQIGGGVMPKSMLTVIADLPQYKDKNLMAQLAPLTKKEKYVMSDGKTIGEHPPLLKSTRIDNHVIYTISLADARLINPGCSYSEPSLETNALLRRLQQIEHRINALSNTGLAYEQLCMIDTGFMGKQYIPRFLHNIGQQSEANYASNSLSRMASGKKGNLPVQIERDYRFTDCPTMLGLHQMGVYIRKMNNEWTIFVYEGRKLRDIRDIESLMVDVSNYIFKMMLPSDVLHIIFRTVTIEQKDFFKCKVNRSITDKIKLIYKCDGIKLKPTNIYDKYFGGTIF